MGSTSTVDHAIPTEKNILKIMNQFKTSRGLFKIIKDNLRPHEN